MIFRSGLLSETKTLLETRLIGQPDVARAILPRLAVYQTGLEPPARPAGVFLLMGPTGTGKTHSVELLAEALHGTPRHMIRVDCGEFQMDHEIAKLIGAPPGYLGHRETQPWFTQQKMSAITTDLCGLSIVLFDEIEKSALPLRNILLGVLDKGVLKLGDSSTVKFDKSLVFMTSNCGASGIMRELRGGFGFRGASRVDAGAVAGRRAGAALRKEFTPEFINRIDEIITFNPLTQDDLSAILDLLLEELNQRVLSTRRQDPFTLRLAPGARRWLLKRGTNPEYGARDLRRTLERHVLHPLCLALAEGVKPSSLIAIEEKGGALRLTCNGKTMEASA